MSTTINDYLPSTTDGNGHHNGNGNGKIFTLKPATDPDTLLILDTRRNALAEPNHRLTRSAKACFCEILDRALHPGFFDIKGVVTISDKILADTFRVSKRSVYSWKRMIEAAGYAWTSAKFKSNMWPITTYHISALHKKPITGKTDEDGTYGGGKLRPAPVNPGQGCRQPGQPILALAGSRMTPPETENTDLQGISALSREKLPLSAEANFGSEPKPASAESRNEFRRRAEANFGGEPKRIAGGSRSNLRTFRDSERRFSLLGGGGEGEPPPEGKLGRGICKVGINPDQTLPPGAAGQPGRPEGGKDPP